MATPQSSTPKALTEVAPARALNLLVVEDHQALREVTVEILSSQGYRVIGIDCAEAVDELSIDFSIDLAILDLNLPGEDGLALAKRLRLVQPGIGIIMVSVRHLLLEKLAGYEHGADMYLTKPTEPQELCAAVQAMARRLGERHASASVAALTLDLSARVLHTPGGPVPLRTTEAKVLHALALAPNNTLETWQLLAKLDKPVDEEGKAQLQVLLSRLRSKLIEHGASTNPILAERGKGYRLCLQPPLRLV